MRQVVLTLVLAAFAAAHKLDEPPCAWHWSNLGCMPAQCKLQWKIRLGTLGPCVLKANAALVNETAAEPACDSSESVAESAEKASAEAVAEEAAPAEEKAAADAAEVETGEGGASEAEAEETVQVEEVEEAA